MEGRAHLQEGHRILREEQAHQTEGPRRRSTCTQQINKLVNQSSGIGERTMLANKVLPVTVRSPFPFRAPRAGPRTRTRTGFPPSLFCSLAILAFNVLYQPFARALDVHEVAVAAAAAGGFVELAAPSFPEIGHWGVFHLLKSQKQTHRKARLSRKEQVHKLNAQTSSGLSD